MRSAPWIGVVDPKQNDNSCTFQVLADGYEDYVYDEYSVIIASMPSNLSAESYWLEFARDPNAAVDRGLFNFINRFTKRRNSAPAIGDIYDIDIVGPDNGSIVLVAISTGFGAAHGDGLARNKRRPDPSRTYFTYSTGRTPRATALISA